MLRGTVTDTALGWCHTGSEGVCGTVGGREPEGRSAGEKRSCGRGGGQRRPWKKALGECCGGRKGAEERGRGGGGALP
eukprot:3932387-Rhodomonas_salina.1